MITLASEVTEWHISVDDLTFDVGKSTSYIGKVVVGKLTRRRNDRYLTLIQYCTIHVHMSKSYIHVNYRTGLSVLVTFHCNYSVNNLF